MYKTDKEFTKDISDNINDLTKTAEICIDLVVFLFTSTETFSSLEADRILNKLRSKRYFSLMTKVANAFIRTDRGTFRVYRQFAQSLIDQSDYDLAIYMLYDLEEKTKDSDDEQAAEENAEALGLLGRAYKDLFIKAGDTDIALGYLQKSISFYKGVFDTDKQNRLWHGINSLTLICRGKKEGFDMAGLPDPVKLADDIITAVDKKDSLAKADAWDYASAAEAYVSLAKWNQAEEWLEKYINDPKADLFALRSTYRQFTDVWKLDSIPEAIPVLRMLADGIAAKENLPPHKTEEKADTSGHEKVYGSDTYKTYEWIENARLRAKAVARIGLEISVGKATGVLIKGSNLTPRLNDDYILLTNAHVISDDPLLAKTYRTPQVCVIFEKVNPNEKFGVKNVYWTSAPANLDATIGQFYPEDQTRINQIGKDAEIFPISFLTPSYGDGERCYIIGHPNGGTLVYSLQDNLLLDFEDPKIHYRTPTDKGSSGSPVFNDNWVLIGLHHKGKETMEKLNGKTGTYEANEAIWIKAIKEQLAIDGK